MLTLTAAQVQRVNVSSCLCLRSLGLRCPALQVLLASGCHALRSFQGLHAFPAYASSTSSPPPPGTRTVRRPAADITSASSFPAGRADSCAPLGWHPAPGSAGNALVLPTAVLLE